MYVMNWSASSHISGVLFYPPSTLQLHLYITNVTLYGHVNIVCTILVCVGDGCSASDPVTLIIITLPHAMPYMDHSANQIRAESSVVACIVWCVVISQVTAV